jgi:hypothetical protein
MSEPAEDIIETVDAAPAPEVVADPTPSAEDRALAMGWTPKGQFKGDPEKWVDAETFVKRGEEFVPFLKANNRRLEQALERQAKETEKLQATLSKFAEHHSRTEQRAYARALSDIEARLDAAAQSGDVQGVRDATEELVELRTEVATPSEPAQPDTPPEFVEWQEANPWFGKDKAKTAATAAIAQDVLTEGFTGKAQIKEVDKRLREKFPDWFENPNRRQAATVEGHGSPPRKAGKGYADLPSDAKAICDDFVKRVPGFTREKYCKDFFS